MGRTLGWLVLLVAATIGIWWFTRDEPQPPEPMEQPDAPAPDEPEPSLVVAPVPKPKVEPKKEDVNASAFPPGAARIEGLVVGTDGLALPKIPVTLHLDWARPFWARYEAGAAVASLDWTGMPVDPRPLARTESDKDGRFTFPGLDPTARLRVRAEPAAPMTSADATTRASAEAHLVRLVLGSGVPLSIHLVDGTGAGRKGTVSISMSDAEDPAFQSWKAGTRETNDDGQLTLASVPAGSLRVDALVPGYGKRTQLVVQAPRDDPFVVVFGMDSGASIHGLVRNENREPVAGARVLVHCGQHADSRVPRWMRMATSDGEGAYRFDGLPPGPVAGIECVAQGYARPQSIYYRRNLAAGEDARVDFDLSSGCFVRGRVLLADGSPVPDAYVETSVFSPGVSIGYQMKVKSAADGSYALGPLPVGNGKATPKARGYFGVEGEHQAVDGHSFVFSKPGETLPIDLVMARGTPVSGRVVDATGSAVGGATILLRGPSSLWTRYPPFGEVATDDAGAFSLPGLPPMGSFFVRVKSGDVSVDAEIQPEGKNEIVLPARGSIFGRVIWPDRAPSGDWVISAKRQGERRGRRVRVTDPVGRFEIHGLDAGLWRLEIPSGFREPSGEPVECEVAAGEQVTGVVLRPETFASIEGVIVDVDGTPKPGHEISVDVPDGSRTGFTLRSGGDGRFRVHRLPPGTYAISGDGVTERAIAQTGATDVRLVVDQVKLVFRGTMLLPDGEPVPKGQLQVRIGERSWYMVSVRSGSFSYEMKPGTSTVEYKTDFAMDARGQPVSHKPVEGTAPINEPLTLRLEAARSIPGIVVDDTGRGVAGVRIFAWDRAGPGGPNTTIVTDAEGRFRLVGLHETSKVQVNVSGIPEGYQRPKSVTVGPQDVEVRIVLAQGASIRGKVVGVDGEPIRQAMVHGTIGGVTVVVYTDAAGAFVIAGVPDGGTGLLQASAERSGSTYLPAQIDEVRAGQHDVVFRLRKGVGITGMVFKPSGISVALVPVVLKGDSGEQRVTASVDGRFRFVPLAPGTYSLWTEAHGEWLGALPIEVVAPAKDVQLRLRRK